MATNRAGNRSRGKARDGRAGNRAAAAKHGNAAARVGNPISAEDTPGGKARGGAGNAGDGGRGGGHAPIFVRGGHTGKRQTKQSDG